MGKFGKHLFVGMVLLASPLSAAAQSFTAPSTERAVSATPRVAGGAMDEAMAAERIEALELRLAQMEQLLEAQRVLQARKQMTHANALRDRLESLEAQLLGAPNAGFANAQTPGTGVSADATGGVPHTAELQTRYNDLAESLRLLQSQTDRLLLQMRTLENTVERTGADNEFRFQALESGVRRANTGISSTSDDEQVIGFVKRAAPVAELESASAGAPATQERLVGEGDLSVLEGFDQTGRATLKDPKALYERALKDLQAGNYAAAELDFAQLLATHPAHELAGNAQYWLGETHYVRRQYKRAAQAFLGGYTTYASSKKAPDSLLKLGMTLTAMGETKTGCNAFAELDAKFPDATNAVRKRAAIERKRANCGS
jgi:tol-pal system protein YbgF